MPTEKAVAQKEEKESSKSKSRKESRKSPNVPEDRTSGSKAVGHFEDAVKENQRVVESWSEGCVGESKCDGKIRPQGIDAVLSAASFRWKRKRLICADSNRGCDPSNVKIATGHVPEYPRHFPIKDDLNSTEILLCEELLKRENDRRSRFNLHSEDGAEKNDRSRITRSQLESTVDHGNFESHSLRENLFRKDRNLRLYRSNAFTEEQTNENDATVCEHIRESRGRRREGKDRRRSKGGNVGRRRWQGSEYSFCPASVDMLARSAYCSRIRSSETSVDTGVSNGRKSGGGEEEDEDFRLKASTERRLESMAKSRTNARPQRTFLTRSSNENNALRGISNENKEKDLQKRRTRGVIKAETSVAPVGSLTFESNSCSRDFRLDATDYAPLEKPSLFRHRIGSGFLVEQKYEERDPMARKNSSTTCCCPESKFSRSRYRCRQFCTPDEFSKRKIDRSSVKLARPKDDYGRINLSKVLVYPPYGEDGPPLTLYKNVSSIRCAVRGSADVGFRYDVTYVQKFSSACFPGYELL